VSERVTEIARLLAEIGKFSPAMAETCIKFLALTVQCDDRIKELERENAQLRESLSR
jgi:hypothetical protein